VSVPVVVYVLTALAAVVVVLTRLRMRGGQGAGRFHVGRRLLDVHTYAGAAAVVVWTVFLVAPEDSPAGSSTVGIIGLGLFWIVTIAGLLILVRWLPSHGKHASAGAQDTWSEGPGLSVLAHVGMLVGVVVFTVAYLTHLV
jgi:hypothetical protein